MSEFFECYIWWIILGILIGFFLFWLYDLLFRRDGDDDQTGGNIHTAATTVGNGTVVNNTASSFTSAPVVDNSQHIVMSAASAELAKSFGLKPQKSNKDDLTVVEGIGPKISQLLYAEGVETFRLLAVAEVENIQKILDNAGPSYKLAKPESWPRQSALCVEQDWKELKEFQDRLFNGVEFDN